MEAQILTLLTHLCSQPPKPGIISKILFHYMYGVHVNADSRRGQES